MTEIFCELCAYEMSKSRGATKFHFIDSTPYGRTVTIKHDNVCAFCRLLLFETLKERIKELKKGDDDAQ